MLDIHVIYTYCCVGVQVEIQQGDDRERFLGVLFLLPPAGPVHDPSDGVAHVPITPLKGRRQVGWKLKRKRIEMRTRGQMILVSDSFSCNIKILRTDHEWKFLRYYNSYSSDMCSIDLIS